MIVPPPVASSLIFGAHRRGEHIARATHLSIEQLRTCVLGNQGQVSPNVSRAKDVQRRAPKKMAQRVAPLPAASNTTTTTPIWWFRTSSVSGGSTPCAGPFLTACECRLRRCWAPAPVTGCGHATGDGRHLAPFLTYLQQESQIDNHAHRNGVVNTRVRRHNWCGDG